MSPVAAIIHENGEVRRIVVTTYGIEALRHHYGPGEDMIILAADQVMVHGVPDLAKAKALVAEKTVA